VAGSGQAAAALADLLRGAEMLAATEALRIGQSFGIEPGMLLDIGEGLSAVGPLVGGILRRQVLTRQFDSGLALGHLLKGLETASSVAKACGVEAPLLAACRDTWAAAETRRDWPAESVLRCALLKQQRTVELKRAGLASST
jgi:3-hydroxyisobutyrate dehydrogenase